MDQPNADIPVYAVQKESGEGRKRTLHRNLLLPVGYISERNPVQQEKPTPAPRTIKTRQQRKVQQPNRTVSSKEDSDSESSDEEWIPHRISFNIPHSVDQPADPQDPPSDDMAIEILGDAQGALADEPIEAEAGSQHDEEERQEQEQPTSVQDEPVVLESPPVSPRRSRRTKVQPKWMTSGEFVSKTAVVTDSWQQKAHFMTDLLSKGVFAGPEQQVGEALIAIIKGPDK